MDYKSEVFKMLGIMPNEEFKLNFGKVFLKGDAKYTSQGERDTLRGKHTINEDLEVSYYDKYDNRFNTYTKEYSDTVLVHILNGGLVIVMPVEITREDKVIIDYAKLCNCNWLARDKDGALWGYKDKPERRITSWQSSGMGDLIRIECNIKNGIETTWKDEPLDLNQEFVVKEG